MTQRDAADTQRCRVAAEVLELGEALFDAVLEATARSGEEGSEALPEAELRTAAEELFQTLRVMLNVADPPAAEPETGRGQEGG